MKKHILLTVSTLAIGLCALPTHAWNALGHKIVAHIAYQQLEPSAKRKVDAIVADFNHDYPEINTIEELAVWPDAIRSQKIETYTHWHYIDMPIIEEGVEADPKIDTDNALWALQKIEPIVENNKANRYERARFLAFLVHIVGDLHQPLHTAALFSKKHPHGDKGGNAYLIRYHNKTMNLHSLWDRGVGAFEGAATPEAVDSIARVLTHRYPKAYFAERLTLLKAKGWVDEGVKNANESVYITPEDQAVSQQYIVNGAKLAEEQVTLAGYRLGMILNQLLG